MHSSRQKEDISISYISALCADAGISYDIQRHDDDSTDGIMKKRIFLGDGIFFDSALRIQLKSTSSVSQYKDKGDIITYALKGKNYNDLCTPATTPIILGLFVMPEEEASWVQWSREELLIKGCMYWADFSKMPKSDHKETVTISIPKGHVENKEFLLDILERQAKEA